MLLLGTVLATSFLLWRDRSRPSPGRCQECGYDLTGNTSGICPECGTPIADDVKRKLAANEPKATNDVFKK
ncbi:MAG: hypothetical protein JXQ75_17800 [Phycisphaerae bacterium]|nr:hypothetical protein [Phycisphaerae bacterium]